MNCNQGMNAVSRGKFVAPSASRCCTPKASRQNFSNLHNNWRLIAPQQFIFICIPSLQDLKFLLINYCFWFKGKLVVNRKHRACAFVMAQARHICTCGSRCVNINVPHGPLLEHMSLAVRGLNYDHIKLSRILSMGIE